MARSNDRVTILKTLSICLFFGACHFCSTAGRFIREEILWFCRFCSINTVYLGDFFSLGESYVQFCS